MGSDIDSRRAAEKTSAPLWKGRLKKRREKFFLIGRMERSESGTNRA